MVDRRCLLLLLMMGFVGVVLAVVGDIVVVVVLGLNRCRLIGIVLQVQVYEKMKKKERKLIYENKFFKYVHLHCRFI